MTSATQSIDGKIWLAQTAQEERFPVRTLLRWLYSPRVQSQESTSVHMLKIPNTGSHTIHTKILHTLIEIGSAVLAAAVPHPGKVTQISNKGQRSTKINIKIKI